jgi:hypothetical protein
MHRATAQAERLDGAAIRGTREGDEHVVRLRTDVAARVKPEGTLWRVHYADGNRSDLMNLTLSRLPDAPTREAPSRSC